MSFTDFPKTIDGLQTQEWETYAPYYHDLQNRHLTNENLRQWLADWSRLSALLWEAGAVIYIEKSLDTADEMAEQAFLKFIGSVRPQAMAADQALKERFLAMGPEELDLGDLALTIREMRNEAGLFRDENIPLLTELSKLGSEYDKLTGGMTADWDGEEKNLSQLEALLNKRDREIRERAWRQMMDLWLADRDELNQLYVDMLALRRALAGNAGLPDYRAYAFREKNRFDYGPEDCFTFHEAIAEVVVPLAEAIYEKRRRKLGLPALRPWDVVVDPHNAPSLKPYQGQEELIRGSLAIFDAVDPALARHFATMADAQLMDLDTRSGKALGGYCSTLPLRRQPFIFMNGAGTHDDVQTMLHEAGHAFHVFETADLPYVWQTNSPMEFAEVASMSMELLSAPYLTSEFGSFYSDSEAARARIEHLESIVLFLPYMAVVDAFQHWVYTHPDQAVDPANCDEVWGDLWDRFLPGIDYSGLEAERVSGWHRKLHIFSVPFYYIEYGIAQVGALQVWRKALQDPQASVAAYRRSLAQGGTKTLPELFAIAGAEFRFDVPMLSELMTLISGEIAELERRV